MFACSVFSSWCIALCMHSVHTQCNILHTQSTVRQIWPLWRSCLIGWVDWGGGLQWMGELIGRGSLGGRWWSNKSSLTSPLLPPSYVRCWHADSESYHSYLTCPSKVCCTTLTQEASTREKIPQNHTKDNILHSKKWLSESMFDIFPK